jgi:hypothetical protein
MPSSVSPIFTGRAAEGGGEMGVGADGGRDEERDEVGGGAGEALLGLLRRAQEDATIAIAKPITAIDNALIARYLRNNCRRKCFSRLEASFARAARAFFS